MEGDRRLVGNRSRVGRRLSGPAGELISCSAWAARFEPVARPIALEYPAEGQSDGPRGFRKRNLPPEEPRERGDAATADPARHDEVEAGQIGRNIEGEAV